jgi:ABC-type phosphate transport system auxiliary subunit
MESTDSLHIASAEIDSRVISTDNPLAQHYRAMQIAFDNEVKRAGESANARSQELQKQLFEAHTAIAERQSLIEMRDRDISVIRDQLEAKKLLLVNSLQDQINNILSGDPFDRQSRGGEGSNKRRREE